MREYRAYILGIDGHRFVRVKEFSSDQVDDGAALNAAKQLADGHKVELWDCGRLVALLSPNGEVVSPELAPGMTSPPSEHELTPNKSPGASVSADLAPEMAAALSPKNHLLLGW